ncbi:DUF4365 domain-containing protein [uncultured Mucilaginibacter sp.]|uniref:DUF4365 domain-containing protein n=1 Tax=uncultured Mucilaginibacter sp. TaxID=797541 RepID=UPI00261A4847|nr:DUF4365 domain-containing protein [uncultured Mucilaginibacter sp.]
MPLKRKKSSKPTNDRKKRIRNHIIADLSANHVERFALLNGFSVECIVKDYGYDLNIYTYDLNGEFENGNIYIQLKASETPIYVSNKTEISFPVDKRDLRAWFNEPMPVIFIFYDAKKEVAYWIYMQQHLKSLVNFDIKKISNNYSIRIPVINIIDINSFQTFRTYKANTLNEIYSVITYR